MKIKKTYQGAIPLNRISNQEDNSELNTYSTQYINSLNANNTTNIAALQDAVKVLEANEYKPSQLIAEVTASDWTSKLSLDGLNLQPGIYEIIYAEYGSEGSGPGHVLRLNNATTGYQGIHMHPANQAQDAAEGMWRIAYHGNCLAYVNGWNQGHQLNYGVYTLHYFNKDWVTVTGQSHLVLSPNDNGVNTGGVDGKWNIILEQGNYNAHETNSITSLSIDSLDSTTIGPGSYIKLYKK